MSVNKELFDLMIKESKKPKKPGYSHDVKFSDFNDQDVRDTANHLISKGLKVELDEFYTGPSVNFNP